jgi:methyl-accepting chemotaxis protein
VEYWFPRAGGKEPLPKLAYLAGFPEWQWIVGTGVYIDDVAAMFKRKIAEAAAVCLIALALVLGLGFLVARSVLRQLGGEPAYAAELMKKAAAGDLTVAVRASSKDSLLGSLDAMLGSLRKMVHDIAASSQAVAQESQRIVSESAEVAQTTGRQSDATAAMAAAMEELTVSINHISESARETQNNSSHAADLASEGEQRTAASVAEIRSIADTVGGATERIRQLVSRVTEIGTAATVIKDISSQTNLLALNAAIEAARAGEQGRGFAVVADEVRALAERTAAATVQIEQMIDTIQADTAGAVSAMAAAVPQVQRGVDLSETVAESLRSIREGAGVTLERIRDVADATREQSVASNSLATQVEQVAQMVERTSASSRETASAADRLQSCSEELRQLVGRFRC